MNWMRDHVWLLAIPLAFIVTVLWTFRRGAKKRYRKDAKIPFHEDISRQPPDE